MILRARHAIGVTIYWIFNYRFAVSARHEISVLSWGRSSFSVACHDRPRQATEYDRLPHVNAIGTTYFMTGP